MNGKSSLHRTPRRARAVAWALGATTLAWGLLAACSDSRPAPPAGTTGTAPPVPTGTTSPDGGPSPLGDAQADAPSDGEVFRCLGEAPLTLDGGDGGDGGAAPTACPSSPTCSAHCADIATNYKLGIAQFAIQCVQALPSCTDPVGVRNCVDLAMGAACVDSTSTAYCQPLVAACDPMAGGSGSNIDQAGCERFGHALAPAGRAAFSACLTSKIEAGTCPVEVIDCANEIRE